MINIRLFLLSIVLFASNIALANPINTVKVGVFNNNPIVFQKEDGSHTGLAIDVLENIATKEGWKLEYVHGVWKDVLKKLKTGEIDLIVGIAYTEQRSKLFTFTQETLLSNYGIVFRNRDVAITSLLDLQGKRIALNPKGIHAKRLSELLKKLDIEFIPVDAKNNHDVLRLIEQGKAEAGAVNRVFSIMHASSHDAMATSIIFNPVEVRYASPKARNKDLVETIDGYLNSMKKDQQSKYHLYLDRWLTKSDRHFKIPTWLKWTALVLVVGFFFAVLMSILLRIQVNARTKKLQESEGKFRSLTENSRDYIMLFDKQCRHIYINPAGLAAGGNTEKEIIGKNHREAGFDPALCDLWEEKIKYVFASGESISEEFGWESVEGKVSLDWRLEPIFDETGKVETVLGIARDITERKKTEEKLKEKEKLETLLAMATTLSHEINNPLTTILGYANNLKD
ncbi:MAG: transporter substrate-binding domain-containing protein, partial [Candidatus Desulfatibia sp.]|uniref:transporter substrate-binding domain-containing protein n=1 Tax=Candidatus Desulfatibia sp. TaxID=3101189 RepID=UPI002F312640